MHSTPALCPLPRLISPRCAHGGSAHPPTGMPSPGTCKFGRVHVGAINRDCSSMNKLAAPRNIFFASEHTPSPRDQRSKFVASMCSL